MLNLFFFVHVPANFLGISQCLQVARAAVAIGMSRGNMVEAIALDHKNIPLRDFAKAGADEGWRVPYCGADR